MTGVFVTNLFPVKAVPKLSQSFTICQSYRHKFTAKFFMGHHVELKRTLSLAWTLQCPADDCT